MKVDFEKTLAEFDALILAEKVDVEACRLYVRSVVCRWAFAEGGVVALEAVLRDRLRELRDDGK